jgi:TRAP-type C4-dicarboxylate transport system substrate-binding protein
MKTEQQKWGEALRKKFEKAGVKADVIIPGGENNVVLTVPVDTSDKLKKKDIRMIRKEIRMMAGIDITEIRCNTRTRK